MNNIDKLNEFLRSLDCKYKTNDGGCAFIAYCIAKNLERLKQHFEVVLYDPDLYMVGSASYNYKLNNGVHHVYIKYNHCRINESGMGIYNDKEDLYYSIKLSSKQILRYYRNTDWNPRYNRHLNASISKKINNFFKYNF